MKLYLILILLLASAGSSAEQAIESISYGDAMPIVRAMDEILPSELKGRSPQAQAGAWPRWIAGLNSRIRARLLQGDEDTLINFLLFGSAYTPQPRLAFADLTQSSNSNKVDPKSPLSIFSVRTRQILESRIQDLLRAMANPKDNERLLFLRSLLNQKGFEPGGIDSVRVKTYIELNLMRMIREAAGYASILEEARRQGDATSEFIQRSTLFSDRGLSLDTSLTPGFALEESLIELQGRKVIRDKSVRRLAIIGPGLDFIDKDTGYDFYAPQTIQPFSTIDSLSRLGLASPAGVEVTTLDVSPKTLEHMRRARRDAAQGKSYVVQLARNAAITWNEDYLRFWEKFGSGIGLPAQPAAQALRAIRIRPDVVLRIHPENLNIITEHKTLPAAKQYDLIIATNILVYYNVFEQSLALANIECMLRPGGLLLSNNALLELPFSRMRSVGYKTAVYSNRASDGDTIVWYQKKTP
jgi:hypothetical protein